MTGNVTPRRLISADSHVIEPTEIWEGILPEGFWAGETSTFSQRPGGFDPKARIDEMEIDGVSAEVLYPSLAMKLFGLDDPDLQRACFRRYNEWLAEYVSVAPQRLAGVGLLSVYDIDAAVADAGWCAEQGFKSVQLWQSPHPDLPFNGMHYEPLWAACAELGLPMSLHILTGHAAYSKEVYRLGGTLVSRGDLMFKLSINQKLVSVMDSLTELLVNGALDRHRGLRFVVVENEVAWLPFFVDQLDYYYDRFEGKGPITLERAPSEAFRDQVFATFFRDPNALLVAERFGSGNIMWSSDYPHGNSTWPASQQVVADRLAGIEDAEVDRLVWGNAVDVFGIDSGELPDPTEVDR